MLFVSIRRPGAAVIVGVSLLLAAACGGRWQPVSSQDVAARSDPRTSYTVALEVAAAKKYTVVSKDPAANKLRLQAKSNGKSFIDVHAVAGQVKLTPAGALVRGDKVHKSLASELRGLRADLETRLSGAAASPVVASASTAPPTAPAREGSSAVPQAWSEPAYDPSVWGNGNFTCLPVRVPQEHQGALALQLSNGEKADLQLSLAYAPELCRSPAQCKQPGGCPALGVGDTERVNRLASRLARREIGSQAVLLDGGTPVANIDLARHGSIVQALAELKH